MASTYVNDLRLNEMATGDASGTWGNITNTNLELIGEALGYATQDCFTSDADATTTVADGATDPARAMYFKVTSSATLSATRTLTIAPNTVSRLQFIENATTGSQSINISQGSGANVTITPGTTKAVYLDGAGSGAAVVDAFAHIAAVDLTVDDDLIIGDDLTFSSDSAVITFGADGDTTLTHTDGSGLTLNSTNKIMFNDASQFIQGSSATVLSLGATDEIDLTATAIDINGAVDMASTLQVDGAITSSAGATITTADNTDQLTLVSTDADANVGPSLNLYRNSASPADSDLAGIVNFTSRNDNSQDFIVASLDASVIDVSDGTEDGRFRIKTMTGGALKTVSFVGGNMTVSDSQEVRFGDAGDLKIYHDGTDSHIDNDTGDLTLDVAGDIILDADGANIIFKNGGTSFGEIKTNSTADHFIFTSLIQDKDYYFQGNDGGSIITALQLDMSNGGAATFNDKIVTPSINTSSINTADSTGTLTMFGGGTNKGGTIELSGGNNTGSTGSGIVFKTGASTSTPTEKMRIDQYGHVTMPNQPAFLAKPASQQSNVATGSFVDIVLGTEIFDNNADFSSNTFTAPVTGRYQLNAMLRLGAVDTASEYYLGRISTSNRNHDEILDSNEYSSDLDYYAFSLSVLTDMDAGDTAKLQVFQNSGTAQTDIDPTDTRFSGYLVC